MNLSNKTYDLLNNIQISCVILAAFSKDVLSALNLPYGDTVQSIFLACASALLAYLKASSVKYYRDMAEVSPETDDDEIAEHEVEEEVG